MYRNVYVDLFQVPVMSMLMVDKPTDCLIPQGASFTTDEVSYRREYIE